MVERKGRLSGHRLLLAGTLTLLALILVASAILDRDPRGRVRVATLPLALTLLDPFTWTALGHSLAVAGAATLLSLLLGVGLAVLLPSGRSWWRGLLLPWLVLPALLPVPVVVLGLTDLLSPADRLAFPAPWGAALPLGPFRLAGAWPLLVWVDLLIGLPMVLIATLRARDRLDPSLADAAHALGISRVGVVLTIVWPLLRPSALRAAGLAFGLALFEPAAPLMLASRRTLAFQIVEAATAADLPRAAALTLVGLMAVAIVHTLFRLRAPMRPIPEATVHVVRSRAGWPRTIAATGASLSWLALAWTPTLSLVARTLPAWLTELRSQGGLPLDPGTGHLVLSSLLIGLAVAVLTLCLARPTLGRGLVGWLRRCPPLAMAVALLAVPAVLRLLADAGPSLAPLEALAHRMDPYRNPGVLLVVGLTLVHLPTAHRAARLVFARTDPAHYEVAWTLGASARRARRDTVLPLVVPGLLRAAILVGLLAATDVAAALVLVTLPGSSPIGPALVATALQPDPQRAERLAVLAAMAVVLPVLVASGIRFWGPDAPSRPSASPAPPRTL